MLEKEGVHMIYPEDKTGFLQMVRPIYDMNGQPYGNLLSQIEQMGNPDP